MRKLPPIFTIVLFPILMWGQTIINGKITDEATHESLIGANIFITNSSDGTSTDIDGNFSLEISEDLGSKVQIEISYTDYTTQSFEVENTDRKRR